MIIYEIPYVVHNWWEPAFPVTAFVYYGTTLVQDRREP